MIGIGLCFLAAGSAAYRGWWRSWLGKGTGYTVLGTAWLGAAFTLVGVAAPLAESGSGASGSGVAKVLAAVLTGGGVACFVVGAVSPFWMWWRLLPQWVRTTTVASPRLRRSPGTGR